MSRTCLLETESAEDGAYMQDGDQQTINASESSMSIYIGVEIFPLLAQWCRAMELNPLKFRGIWPLRGQLEQAKLRTVYLAD